jgi:hypothetical protein
VIRLTERCEVWRIPSTSPRRIVTLLYRNVPSLRVPISSFDGLPDYARRSTHIVFVPRTHARLLRTEDELRTGRRVTNSGQVVAHRYGVDGVRDYRSLGVLHTEVFCTELRDD